MITQPSSNLILLRKELQEINTEFLSLYHKRLHKVSQIVWHKEDLLKLWDPIQEYKLFKQYVLMFPMQDHAQDLIFSITIELQANSLGKYPRWSLGEHLQEPVKDSIGQINPILLLVRNKAEYQALNLKEEYLRSLSHLT